MATYITKNGQTIFDLAIQLYGDISGLANIMRFNPNINLGTKITEGTNIEFHESLIVNLSVVDFINTNRITIANGEGNVYIKNPNGDISFIIYASQGDIWFTASGSGTINVDWGDNSDIEIISLSSSPQRIYHTFNVDILANELRKISVYTDDADFTLFDSGSNNIVRLFALEEINVTSLDLSQSQLDNIGFVKVIGDSTTIKFSQVNLDDLTPLIDQEQLRNLYINDANLDGQTLDEYFISLVKDYRSRPTCNVRMWGNQSPSGEYRRPVDLTDPQTGLEAIWVLENQRGWTIQEIIEPPRMQDVSRRFISKVNSELIDEIDGDNATVLLPSSIFLAENESRLKTNIQASTVNYIRLKVFIKDLSSYEGTIIGAKDNANGTQFGLNILPDGRLKVFHGDNEFVSNSFDDNRVHDVILDATSGSGISFSVDGSELTILLPQSGDTESLISLGALLDSDDNYSFYSNIVIHDVQIGLNNTFIPLPSLGYDSISGTKFETNNVSDEYIDPRIVGGTGSGYMIENGVVSRMPNLATQGFSEKVGDGSIYKYWSQIVSNDGSLAGKRVKLSGQLRVNQEALDGGVDSYINVEFRDSSNNYISEYSVSSDSLTYDLRSVTGVVPTNTISVTVGTFHVPQSSSAGNVYAREISLVDLDAEYIPNKSDGTNLLPLLSSDQLIDGTEFINESPHKVDFHISETTENVDGLASNHDNLQEHVARMRDYYSDKTSYLLSRGNDIDYGNFSYSVGDEFTCILVARINDTESVDGSRFNGLFGYGSFSNSFGYQYQRSGEFMKFYSGLRSSSDNFAVVNNTVRLSEAQDICVFAIKVDKDGRLHSIFNNSELESGLQATGEFNIKGIESNLNRVIGFNNSNVSTSVNIYAFKTFNHVLSHEEILRAAYNDLDFGFPLDDRNVSFTNFESPSGTVNLSSTKGDSFKVSLNNVGNWAGANVFYNNLPVLSNFRGRSFRFRFSAKANSNASLQSNNGSYIPAVLNSNNMFSEYNSIFDTSLDNGVSTNIAFSLSASNDDNTLEVRDLSIELLGQTRSFTPDGIKGSSWDGKFYGDLNYNRIFDLNSDISSYQGINLNSEDVVNKRLFSDYQVDVRGVFSIFVDLSILNVSSNTVIFGTSTSLTSKDGWFIAAFSNNTIRYRESVNGVLGSEQVIYDNSSNDLRSLCLVRYDDGQSYCVANGNIVTNITTSSGLDSNNICDLIIRSSGNINGYIYNLNIFNHDTGRSNALDYALGNFDENEKLARGHYEQVSFESQDNVDDYFTSKTVPSGGFAGYDSNLSAFRLTSGSSDTFISRDNVFIVGKRYMVEFDNYTIISGSSAAIFQSGFGGIVISSEGKAEFTATSHRLSVDDRTSTNVSFTGINITEIGEIVDYSASGLSDDFWISTINGKSNIINVDDITVTFPVENSQQQLVRENKFDLKSLVFNYDNNPNLKSPSSSAVNFQPIPQSNFVGDFTLNIGVNNLFSSSVDGQSFLFTTLNSGADDGITINVLNDIGLNVRQFVSGNGDSNNVNIPKIDGYVLLTFIVSGTNMSIYYNSILAGTVALRGGNFLVSADPAIRLGGGKSWDISSMSMYNFAVNQSDIFKSALGELSFKNIFSPNTISPSTYTASGVPVSESNISDSSSTGFTLDTDTGATSGAVDLNFDNFDLYANRGKSIKVSFEYNLNTGDNSYFGYSTSTNGLISLSDTSGSFVAASLDFVLGNSDFTLDSKFRFFVDSDNHKLVVRNIRIQILGNTVRFSPTDLSSDIWRGQLNMDVVDLDVSSYTVSDPDDFSVYAPDNFKLKQLEERFNNSPKIASGVVDGNLNEIFNKTIGFELGGSEFTCILELKSIRPTTQVMGSYRNISSDDAGFGITRGVGEGLFYQEKRLDGSTIGLNVAVESDLDPEYNLIALVKEGSNVKFYINGKLITDDSRFDNEVVVRELFSPSRNFEGLGNQMYFNRALSQSEILDAALGIIDENEKGVDGEVKTSNSAIYGLASDQTGSSSLSTATQLIDGLDNQNIILNDGAGRLNRPSLIYSNLFPNANTNGGTYNIKLHYRVNSGVYHPRQIFINNVIIPIEYGNPVTGEGVIEFTETISTNFNNINFLHDARAGAFDVDVAIEVTRIGQVANYPASNLNSNYWIGEVNGEENAISTSNLDVVVPFEVEQERLRIENEAKLQALETDFFSKNRVNFVNQPPMSVDTSVTPSSVMTFNCNVFVNGPSTSTATSSTIIESRDGGNNNARILASIDSNGLLRCFLGSTVITGGVVRNGFHLITIVINGNSVSAYVDGVLNLQGNSDENYILPTTDFVLGNRTTLTSVNFNGSIGSYSFFNRALQQDEILDVALGIVDSNERNAIGNDRFPNGHGQLGINSDVSLFFDTPNGQSGTFTVESGSPLAGFSTYYNITHTVKGTGPNQFQRPSLFFNNFENYFGFNQLVNLRVHYRVNSGDTRIRTISSVETRNLTLAESPDMVGTGFIDIPFRTRGSVGDSAILFDGNDLFDVDIALEFFQIGQVANFTSTNLTDTVWRGEVNGQVSNLDVSPLTVESPMATDIVQITRAINLTKDRIYTYNNKNNINGASLSFPDTLIKDRVWNKSFGDIWSNDVRSSSECFINYKPRLWCMTELNQRFIFDNILDSFRYIPWIKVDGGDYSDYFQYDSPLTGDDRDRATRYVNLTS